MRILYFVVTVATAADLFAGSLAWKESTVEVAAKASDTKAEAVFEFTNQGPATVKIRKISTSCGCTIASADRDTYGAGASGVVKVTFTFGNRKGFQEKTVLVQTDGAGRSPEVLTFRVQIPESVLRTPDRLVWTVGDALAPKQFTVEVVEPRKTTVHSARAMGANFSVELANVSEGRYDVIATPTSTDRPMRGTIKVEIAEPTIRALYLPVEVIAKAEQ